jgi:hypothetical protein
MKLNMRFAGSIIVSVFLFAVLGCGSDNLPQYSKLDRLRILGITTPTPELQNPAGGTVNVNIVPYISDVGGNGNITLQVQSCLDPGTSLGAAPTCTGASYTSAPQTVTVTAPAGQADGVFGTPERTGAPSTGAITVGLNVPAGLLLAFSSSIQNNGVPYLITVTVTSSSGVIRAYRRILISTKVANTNPTLTNLLSQGVPLASFPNAEVQLSFASSGSPESYSLFGTDGSVNLQTETYETTWFVSDGEILNPRTKAGETTTWSAGGAAPSGRKSIVAGVLRDGRGGMSVLIRTF